MTPLVQRLASELPADPSAAAPAAPPLAAASAAALSTALPRATMLRHVLQAAALTMAHGFVDRWVCKKRKRTV